MIAGASLPRVVVTGTLCLGLLATSSTQEGAGDPTATPAPESNGCLACHAGIEEMHPEAELSCVDCHGGDQEAADKARAHVRRPSVPIEDERTPPPDRDLAWRRFRNPSDLRVVNETCGECHAEVVERLRLSLHSTTAGHLSDGFYEMGLSAERGSRYSIFPVEAGEEEAGEVEELVQVPAFRDRHGKRKASAAERLAANYADLARKECMQCHLWSEGRAVRGRVGFDGDYRGDGCATCHVVYDRDGFSRSGDAARVDGEPGHPRTHTMTATPTTQTCTSCHYGDASIGLHFRGLSQLPPNAPGGPQVPGTTDTQLNRAFYLNDPSIVPPDLHFERGMDCIDCHTTNDVMGDGKLHGQMEHQVEISCEACHGTFERRSSLRTERGTPLTNLRRDGSRVILTVKASGEELEVPQVVDVIDPDSDLFNPDAARAMDARHGNTECYTCHSGWNVNFLGFHFSRNASLSQLDLLSGKVTPGRVTTQEKVFATWKSFYAGLDQNGRVAPYLTGFSTMGSVWDEEGKLVLDQAMPETRAGLSGMTMVHHQLHTVRPTARSCVECHRASATWGLGSPNFRLTRQLAFVADRRGIEVVGLVRSQLSDSRALCLFPIPDVVDLAVRCDPLQGHADYLFVAEGGRGVHVLDVRNPVRPERVAFLATIDPRALELVGDQLFVADGIGGLAVVDVSDPGSPSLAGRLATVDAQDVDVQWPVAYIADGGGGLCVADVRVPIAPTFLSSLDLDGSGTVPDDAAHVASLFQYSRPLARDGVPIDRRTRARNLVAVLDRGRGLFLFDLTEPTRPKRLAAPKAKRSRNASDRFVSYRGLVLLSQVDPADPQGGAPTEERDYAYILEERGSMANRRSKVRLFDVTDPRRMRLLGGDRETVPAGFATEALVAAEVYNPPFRQRVLFAAGERGVFLADVTISRDARQVGVLPGIKDAYAIAFEEFPLDRMVDELGRPLKDISHPRSRWLNRSEFERVLTVSSEDLGTDLDYPLPPDSAVLEARRELERLDQDGSTRLEGEELEEVAEADFDGDGRVVLGELVRHVGRGETGRSRSIPSEEVPSASGERVFPDGDLAKLLDGTNPYDFDRDADGILDRRELDAAFLHALDLDGSGSLSIHELSRYPGERRSLRFADETAVRLFGKRRGTWSRREFHIEDAEWEALDRDGDGRVRLVRSEYAFEREHGVPGPGSEWPTRRVLLVPLPPGIGIQDLLERLDEDDDG
ncbi:MAG TPA: hypothetical protein ENJ09_11980, partial [Planctomycetes bacterium]|nr:hypothetical protein [Planctomycetota bacterium]